MINHALQLGVEKLMTGISGFDFVAMGGLPKGRSTTVAGTSGSGKTVFVSQFLVEGIRQFGEAGVFVTFEEPPAEIRCNLLSLGWDVEKWEKAGKWTFVDVSPDPTVETTEVGRYDLSALLARIQHAVRKVGAKRVVIDSIASIFTQFADASVVRRELLRIAATLRGLGVTSVITVERLGEQGEVGRFGIEDFVADAVIILRNALSAEERRRTIEILKFRGTNHHKGEYPYTITSSGGLEIIPLSAIEMLHACFELRMSTGSADLDAMCGGGLFRGAIALASGATGSGKTLLVSHFIGAIGKDERALLISFEESPDQLRRNARGWGGDFARLEAEGRLNIVSSYPESATIDDHLIRIKRLIEEFKPARLAIDSMSALERISSNRSFREFAVALTAYIKKAETTALLVAVTPGLMGGESVTEGHISSITDTILLLRYVESDGEIRRGIAVLKNRGSDHDKGIRELVIDNAGLHIGAHFDQVAGIITGRSAVSHTRLTRHARE